MDRRGVRAAGPGLWIAAAAGLAMMALLAAVGFGLIGQARSVTPAGDVGAADTLAAALPVFGWGVLALIGVAVLDIVVAWGLWGVLRGERPGGAALAAAFRVAYAAVFLGAIAMLVDARRIAMAAGEASDLAVGDRDAAVLLRFEGFDSAWNTGLLVFGVHLLIVGWLVATRSGVFATVAGWLVVLAGAGYLADGVVRVIAPDVTFSIARFTFIGEIVLIVWLAVGGIRTARSRRHAETETETETETARVLVGGGAGR